MPLRGKIMHAIKTVKKRKFIRHANEYLKLIESQGTELIITHQNQPDLLITKIKSKTLKDLRGLMEIKVHGDINESILPGHEE
jgi:hypothetical protein